MFFFFALAAINLKPSRLMPRAVYAYCFLESQWKNTNTSFSKDVILDPNVITVVLLCDALNHASVNLVKCVLDELEIFCLKRSLNLNLEKRLSSMFIIWELRSLWSVYRDNIHISFLHPILSLFLFRVVTISRWLNGPI